jgi:DNA-binding LacI/PurR family transcriptional regulator
VGDEAVPGRIRLPFREFQESQVDVFVDAGHSRLALAQPTRAAYAGFAAPRVTMLERICAERGLPAPVVFSADHTMESAKTALAEVMSRPEAPTAVLAYDDTHALALLAAARLLGIRVPAEMAVIGTGNSPEGALSDPPLTTVSSETPQLAQRLIDYVMRRLDGCDEPLTISTEWKMRVTRRGSV